MCQDNKSTILLEVNRKKIIGNRTRELNTIFFFIINQVEKGNIMIEYYNTNNIIEDFMIKPLIRIKFTKFRDKIVET